MEEMDYQDGEQNRENAAFKRTMTGGNKPI